MKLTNRFLVLAILFAVLASHRADAISVEDIDAARLLSKVLTKLEDLRKIQQELSKTRETLLLIGATYNNWSRFRRNYLSTNMTEFVLGKGCQWNTDPWYNARNIGADASRAIRSINRNYDWNCSTLGDAPPDVIADARFAALIDNLLADGLAAVGKSRSDQRTAHFPIQSLVGWSASSDTTSLTLNENLQKVAAGAITASGLIRDIERTNAAILEIQTALVDSKRQNLVHRVNTAVRWRKMSPRAFDASGVSSPFTGL